MQRYVVGWAVVAALVCGGFASDGWAETRDERIERLERELGALREELDDLKREKTGQDAAAAKTGEESIPGPVATAPVPRTLEDLAHRVTLGGYGSLRFESNSAEDTHETFTFRRFVLTADAAVAPKLRFYLELEFERFRKLELEQTVRSEGGGLEVEHAVEGTNESELSIEQLWLEYAFADALRFRAGGILVPLGRFNLNHDDNRWNLPRRSLVDRGVPALPVKAAWDELGAGFNGALPVGEAGQLDYQFYVVNGAVLTPELESKLQTRSGDSNLLALEGKLETDTGTFGNDVKSEKAITGRLAWSPSLGHEIAGSFYRGRYTPDFLPNEAITAFSFDGITTWGPFELEGEFVQSHFGDVDRVARGLASSALEKEAEFEDEDANFETEIEFELARLARTRRGYWLEGRYRFWPAWLRESLLGRPFDDPELVAVLRWEQVWLQGLIDEVAFTGGALTGLEKSNRRVDRVTIGGAYRPVPLVAFQLAYEYTKADHGGLDQVTNYLASSDDSAHAVLLGATFGF